MSRGRLLVHVGLLLALVVLAPAGTAGDAPTVDRVEVDPQMPTVEGSVSVRVFVDGVSGHDRARLHAVVDHADGETVLHPPEIPAGGDTVLLFAYWEPPGEGPYQVDGHVHVGEHRLELHPQEGLVRSGWSQDPTSPLPEPLAPGSILWGTAFAGLALAAYLARP